MFKRTLSLALIFGMAALAPPAVAQQLGCGARDAITEKLAKSYGEQQTSLGLQTDSRLIEVWTSTETGSWTILLTTPDGTSCVLAAGQNWLEETGAMMADLGVPS